MKTRAKTGGRQKGSGGLRVFITLPRATVEKIIATFPPDAPPSEKEIRAYILRLIISSFGHG